MGSIIRSIANNITTSGVLLPAAINNTTVSLITALSQVDAGGAYTLITTSTASNSANISFTSGIDSTYPIYKFEWTDCHPATDNVKLGFNGSLDGGSSFAVTKTSTVFNAYHSEDGGSSSLGYRSAEDTESSTDYQYFQSNYGGGADECGVGELWLFSPSEATNFNTNYFSRTHNYHAANYSIDCYTGGYFHTTDNIDAIDFKMSSGNIETGTFKMYGVTLGS